MEDFQKDNLKELIRKIGNITHEDIYRIHPPIRLGEMLKKEAGKFLALSEKYYPYSIDYTKEDQETILFNQKVSRIFLGIACEYILKTTFLVKGYCIHEVKDKIEQRRLPLKYTDIKNKNLIYDKTIKFSDLLEKIDLILEKKVESESINMIKLYFSIAADWRNNDIHLGVRHWERGGTRESIRTCFKLLQKICEAEILKHKIRELKENNSRKY